LSIHAVAAKPKIGLQPEKVVRWINGEFLRPVFAASRVQHISDMRSKFALRPHTMCVSMVDIQSTMSGSPSHRGSVRRVARSQVTHVPIQTAAARWAR